MFDMHFDLTNMYAFKVNVIKILANRSCDIAKITKSMFVNRKATMKDFYMETASMLQLMQGDQIANRFSSIVFAIRDNRLSM